jgi:uncharacterized membrane protein YbhN (UPF0104 family)
VLADQSLAMCGRSYSTDGARAGIDAEEWGFTMKRLSRLRRPLQYAFAAIAVVSIVIVLASNWNAFTRAVASMAPAWVAGSFVAGVAGVVLSMLAWRSVLASFGFTVGVGRSASIVFISQIGKYIPGGVWPIVAGTRLGMQAGIPAATMAITLLLQLVVSVATGGVVSIGVLLAFPALGEHYWWLIVLALLLGFAALLPPVMSRWLRWVFALIRRQNLLPEDIRGAQLGMATVWSLASWLAFGVSLWCILCASSGLNINTLLVSVSGYSLAWVAGFLAIITPAGAGVREAVLGLVLVGSNSAPEIIGVVLVSRVVLIVVDVTLFSLALLANRWHANATLTQITAEEVGPASDR